MTSTSGNDGTVSDHGHLRRHAQPRPRRGRRAEPDLAGEGRLPNEVKQVGISVTKVSSNFVLAAGGLRREGRVRHAVHQQLRRSLRRDEIKRVPGVGDVIIFGSAATRCGCGSIPTARRPQHHRRRGRGGAARAERAGRGRPGRRGAGARRADLPDQRARRGPADRAVASSTNIILKRSADGALVRVKDVGRTELGAESYSHRVALQRPRRGRLRRAAAADRQRAAGLPRRQRRARAAVEALSARAEDRGRLRHDDASSSESIREVVTTLLEAIGLVVLVMFLFLQNWRTTLIPAITIPVSLIGTFAFVKLFGFSINTLTLFGITLATGLVVDDAIVVIENIERHIHEHHRPPQRGGVGGDGRGDGRGHRDGAGAGRGVRAGGVLSRHDRPALSAVRADDRVVDGDLGVQRADADAGAGRRCCSAKTEKPKGAVLPRRQPRHRRRHVVHGVDAARPDPRARAVVTLVFVAAARRHLLGLSRACRPGSCPTRIRATSWSSSRRRRAPRSTTR